MSIKTKLAGAFRSGLTLISPKLNTKVTYFVKFHKRLDLSNPVRFDEKLQWLKFNTYWNNPLVKQCADKFKVRDYIEKCGLNSILNELIAVYETPEQIEWDKLPKSFALKLNVGCGFNHIIADKSKEDFVSIKKETERWIRQSKTQYLAYSEMQYKDVKPYILVEKYLGNAEKGTLPTDYKVYCFNGEPEFVMTCVGRENGGHPKFYFFYKNWKLARISRDSKKAPEGFTLPKPEGFDDLMMSAKKLSEPFPFVRADFYICGGRVVFGELTFTPSGGMDTDRLPDTDKLFYNMLKLPDRD